MFEVAEEENHRKIAVHVWLPVTVLPVVLGRMYVVQTIGFRLLRLGFCDRIHSFVKDRTSYVIVVLYYCLSECAFVRRIHELDGRIMEYDIPLICI